MLRLDSLSLPLDFTPETLNALILRKLKCAPEQLKSVVPLKKGGRCARQGGCALRPERRGDAEG